MADVVSSLPIESRTASNPVKVSKDLSANAVANPIFTQLSDGTNVQVITAAGSLKVDIAEQSLTAVAVSKDGTANSAGNPIFVQLSTSVITGEIHDYDVSVAVAGAGGTSDHDYTVTVAKTLLLRRIIASASGSGKFEVKVGPVATLVSKAVQFNSTADPNVEFVFDPPIEVPDTSTGTVRVTRTNREGAAQDVYSTIMGLEV